MAGNHGAPGARAEATVARPSPLVAVTAIAAGMASGFNIANIGAVAKPLAVEYGVGLATVGLFTTALFAMHMVMQVPGGHAADRLGARTSLLAAMAVLIFGNGVALLAPDPVLALAARALCGVGTGLGFIGGSDYIRASGGSPTLQGIYGGGSLAAPGLALVLVPPLEDRVGFRGPYLAALAAALAVLALLTVAPSVRPLGAAHRGRLRALVGDWRLLRLATAHASSFGLSVVVGNWVATLLLDRGYSRGAAGLAAALTLFLGLPTRTLGGWIVRHGPRFVRRAIVGATAAAAAATLVLAAPLPYAALLAAAAVVGLAAGLPFAPVFTAAARVRPDAPGAAVGFVNGWAALTVLVGTPLLGLSFSLPGGAGAGFAAVAAFWALALVALPQRDDLQ